MVAGPVGCGVLEHEEACLCDVDIDKYPVPAIEDAIKNYTEDVAMAREVAEMRGYSAPWTPQTTLAFMCDVQRFWDAWKSRFMDGELEYGSLQEVPPFVWDSSVLLQDMWRRVREVVLFCLSRFDDPCVVVLRHLNVSAQQFADAVSQGRSTREWSMDDMARLEECFTAPIVNIAQVAREFRVSDEQASSLKKYWAERRGKTHASDNPARDMLHDLARTSDLKPTAIVNMVREKYGVSYSVASVSKFRARLNREGQ